MSQDNPDIHEILTTVKEFAQAVAGRSAGAERYDALCAAFLMGVVQRELNLGAEQDDEHRAELRALLAEQGALPEADQGRGSEQDELAELYKRFSDSVRQGDYDSNWQSAFDFAFKQVVDKVKVTNPKHLEAEHRGS